MASSEVRGIAAMIIIVAWGCASAQASDATDSQLPQTVIVRASADASATGLTKAYAGGQVARGGRAGILGDQDMMSSPVSMTSFTNELIQDRQSRSVGDVLLQDPAVRVARGFGNFQESYFIRGFVLSSDNVAYNGLYALLPRQYIAAELFDRVEVLRGASEFLNGASPGGDAIGGSINLLPKRAPDAPLTEATVGDATGSQAYVATDIARRFGESHSAGVRLAASHRVGGTGTARENVDTTVFMIGFDWRSSVVRLSADLGHQDNRLERIRPNVTLAPTAAVVPRAPHSTDNWAQPWSYSNERDNFGTIRAEADLSSSVTAWLAAGARGSHEANSLANLVVTNGVTGDAATYRFDNSREDAVVTGEVGIRVKGNTGAVKHTWLADASAFKIDKRNAFATSPRNALVTNLFAPVDAPLPAFTTYGNDLANPRRTSEIKLTSFAVGDTASMWDDRLLVTVGERHQKFDVLAFAYNTGAEGAPYANSRNSPFIAAVVKASGALSAYANYGESLAMGDTAPSSAANFSAQLPPYVSKQAEFGLKFDTVNLGGSAAFFSTRRPRSAIGTDNVFGVVGEDRHQGFELTAFGKPMPTLRVLGGLSFLDARQRSTGNAATDGKRVIGVPNLQGNVDLDFGVPGIDGLSADVRAICTGRVYANATNTLEVPAWSRLDVGLRYATRWSGREFILRARVDNIVGSRYWSSSGGFPGSGYIVLGSPRTLTGNLTAAF